MRVVTVGEDGAPVAKRTMRGVGHANREALHASRERLLVVGLDDEVQVVRLHREVHHAKARLLAHGNRVAKRFEEQPITPEARQPFACPQSNVDRIAGEMRRAPSVRYPHLASRGLATSPGTRASMSKGRS